MERHASGGRAASRAPLRTYGKRTIPRDSDEPPAKKQRTDDSLPKPSKATAAGPSVGQQLEPLTKDPQPTVPRATAQPKKGSILSYFKVTSPSSGAASPCEHPADPALPPSTPPSSPPRLQSSRKRRRLTTKPIHASCDPVADDSSAMESPNSPDRALWPGHTSPPDSSSSTPSIRAPKQEIRLHTAKRGTVRKPKPRQATVQTIISLSLNEKGFAECADCNTLYNPLHPKDVKLHARQHAAFLRKAKKSPAVPQNDSVF